MPATQWEDNNTIELTQLPDDDLMAIVPRNEAEAHAIATELRRRAEAQFREADQLERWGRSRKLNPA